MINDQAKTQRRLPFLILSASALCMYLLLTWLLSKPFIGRLSLGNADEEGLLRAVRHDDRNASYYFLLGRFYLTTIERPDVKRAIDHYRTSIRLTPLQAGAWLDLAKAYRADGQITQSEDSFERAVKLSPNNADLMWEAGTYWLINNKPDMAVAALKRYLLLVPERQKDVYDLCWKLNVDNRSLLRDLVPDTFEYRSTYLSYLIAAGHVPEAREAWNTIEMQHLDQDLFITYVNFLIAHNLYDEAGKVWEEINKQRADAGAFDERALMWNPGFEDTIVNGGFDWMITERDGVNVFIDDSIRMSGNRSLGVSFDGQHNPDIIMARQIVPVTPSSQYSLRGYVRTESLTTTNGIVVSVSGHTCSGLHTRSEVLTGSNFWKEVSIDFAVPAECRAVIIAIRRDKSDKFDNKIEGTAWIDGMTLKPRALSQTRISEKR